MVSDKPLAASHVDSSKLALKQMIERKQYNDAVRRREFDKLRQLRLNPLGMSVGTSATPSSFQDSWGYSVFEERANTLKKIDEIEAQMSKQWWKARDGAVGGAPPPERVPMHGPDSAFATTMPSDLADSAAQVTTRMGIDTPQGGAESDSGLHHEARETAQTVAGAFSTSVLEPLSTGVEPAEPTLEEAAIRFANGDDGGAEALLLNALAQPGAPASSLKGWVCALLDLYRATAQQTSFERVAAEFAQRFGGAPPRWVANSSPIALDGASSTGAPADGEPLTWRCPGVLDAAGVMQLQAWVRHAGHPWCLDWAALRSLTLQAAQALQALFTHWCGEPLKLRWEGVDALLQLVRDQTRLGDTTVAQDWWLLRLATLRALRLQDEFEAVAMDFCVTYEISPPSWQPVRCQRLAAQHAPVAAVAQPVPERPELASPLVLAGELLGDIAASLPALPASAQAPRVIDIGCASLVRVDFSAAGSLLNWLANAQARGDTIRLHGVPQLLLAFFNLIGIQQHAQLELRNYQDE